MQLEIGFRVLDHRVDALAPAALEDAVRLGPGKGGQMCRRQRRPRPAAASRRRSPSVRKKDHDEPGVEDLAQPARDEVEHPRQLVLGREGISHLDQGLEPVRPALRGLEEPCVLDGHGSLGGEQRHELLVLVREVAAAFFLGQVQVPVGGAAQEDRHPEERVHLRMPGRKPDRARIIRDVVEPERLSLVDQDTEDPASARQVADGGDATPGRALSSRSSRAPPGSDR